MKPTLLVLPLAMLLLCCSPTKKITTTNTVIPDIGEIGKLDITLFHKDFLPVGKPSLIKPITLAARQIPFTKSQFKAYAQLKQGGGEEVPLQYIDSILNKPKYISLEISDRIGLQQQLNGEVNSGAREYLVQDESYGMVTKVSLRTKPSYWETILASDEVYLSQTSTGTHTLEIHQNNTIHFIPFSELEIFEYTTASFCWGLNKYGKEIIKAIPTTGEACPHNTEKKAYKLNENKSYLRFK
ncbi:hypothetical protein [Spongiimicrobium sp. 3-5]|uniref:hypothetical protein n=1 Tax=Spongiimicrobium sp. 3-5 TaxID=3332596 RepID=UPI0039818EEE